MNYTITDKAKNHIDNCRFCWMCRHICPIGNATGQERNTARARALVSSMYVRGSESMENIVDNLYECTLCGACTNNCVTGWDPKIFIRELRTSAIMQGVIPEYVRKMIGKYQAFGNVYGEESKLALHDESSDVLFYVGTDASIFTPDQVENAIKIFDKANVKVACPAKQPDSGEELYFLTGKTDETFSAMKKCADFINRYKKVVVYDPMDLKLFLHEYNEWGIAITAEIVGFNTYILELIENGQLHVNKGQNEYTVQDNFAYARDLDDVTTARRIIDTVGTNKDMLLCGKEANFAGSLLMYEYMPEVITQVANDRWFNAVNMSCKTIVTESPCEYVMLKRTAVDGYRVITVEEAILENM